MIVTHPQFSIPSEVAAITQALVARRDPGYEWDMRRTVPSWQPAHATRVPVAVRKAVAWARDRLRKDHMDG